MTLGRLPANIVLCLLAVSSSATANGVQDVRVSVLVSVRVTVPAETPADASVYLAGSSAVLGDWKADGVKLTRQADGSYTANLRLSPGETLEFKFTRGSWETVEKNADGSERSNRSVTINATTRRIDATVERWSDGTRKDPATEPASTVVGTLRLHEIDSVALHAKRTIRVWLPPGYDDRSTAGYDVLYMHDGQNCFDSATSAFGHEWEIDESLSGLIQAKTIRPLIVVGIDNGGANRIDELTFDANPNTGGGQGDDYAKFLLNEVRPYVEQHYRVATGREHAYLGGSSLGGLASIEIARRHPDAFAGVIAMSPSLWWNDQSLTNAIEHDATSLHEVRIYLDTGTRENGEAAAKNLATVAAAQRLGKALGAAGVEHRLEIVENAAHNEQAWSKRFPDAIQFLLK